MWGVSLTQSAQEEEEQPTLRPGALFAKPASRKRSGTAARSEVTPGRAEKLSKWDQHMKRFEYVKALDAVLQVGMGTKGHVVAQREGHRGADGGVACAQRPADRHSRQVGERRVWDVGRTRSWSR